MKRAAVAFPTCWTVLLNVGGGLTCPRGTHTCAHSCSYWHTCQHVCITGAWETRCTIPKATDQFCMPTPVISNTHQMDKEAAAPQSLVHFRNYHHTAEHPPCAWAGSLPPSPCPPSTSLTLCGPHPSTQLVALCSYDNQKRLQTRPRHPGGQNWCPHRLWGQGGETARSSSTEFPSLKRMRHH